MWTRAAKKRYSITAASRSSRPAWPSAKERDRCQQGTGHSLRITRACRLDPSTDPSPFGRDLIEGRGVSRPPSYSSLALGSVVPRLGIRENQFQYVHFPTIGIARRENAAPKTWR